MRRFGGKVAVIVGAGDGIAATLARMIADEGGIVAAVDRDPDKLDALGDKSLEPFSCNALDAEAVDVVVADILARNGQIDILVNAVGGSTGMADMNAPLDALRAAEWQDMLSFNLMPTFNFCHAVIPAMKARRTGKIVNVSSHAAYGIDVASSAYAAAKAGIVGLTRKLARELGPFNIYCNATAPSRTLTQRVVRMMEDTGNKAGDEYLERIPLRRLATVEEQASAIRFLASSESDYITGVTLDVTGGQ